MAPVIQSPHYHQNGQTQTVQVSPHPTSVTHGETASVDTPNFIPTQESFTIIDRRELIRQGLMLDSLKESMEGFQILVNESIKTDRYGSRIRSLEDDNLRLKTRMSTILWMSGAIAGCITTVAEIIIKLLFK